MEEIKKTSEGCGNGSCVCACGTCMNMHRFCGKHVCLMRAFFAVIIVCGIFMAGFCAGIHEGREGYGKSFGESRGYRTMMQFGDAPAGYSGWESAGYAPTTVRGNTNVMYRMMGSPAFEEGSSSFPQ